MDLNEFLGKKIRVIIDTHIANIPTRIYTGEILSIEDDFLTFKDKFDKKILIKFSDILRIEEINNEQEGNKNV